MGKENNIIDFNRGIADAIREKEGSTDLINPQEFEDRIRNLSAGTSAPAVIGFILFRPGLGDGFYDCICYDNWEGKDFITFNDLNQYYIPGQSNITISEDGFVLYNDCPVYYDLDEGSWFESTFSNPVKATDKVESTIYYYDTGGLV